MSPRGLEKTMNIVDVLKSQAKDLWYTQDSDSLNEITQRDDYPTWQIPLLGAADNLTHNSRNAMIEKAGGIWIRNYDLSSEKFLWIEDVQTGEAWCFERATRAGELPGTAGPLTLTFDRQLPRWIGHQFRYFEGSLPHFLGDKS